MLAQEETFEMAIKRPKRPLLSLAFFLMLLGLASVKLVHERFASSRALAERGETVAAVLVDKEISDGLELRTYHSKEEPPRVFVSKVNARGRALGKGDIGTDYVILYDPQDHTNLRIMRSAPTVTAELDAMHNELQFAWAMLALAFMVGGWGLARWYWSNRPVESLDL